MLLQRAFISTFEENVAKMGPMAFSKTTPKFDEEDRKWYCAIVDGKEGRRYRPFT